MSGPIVRTGTTPKFWENWEQAFGGGKSPSDAPKKSKKKEAAPKAEKKSGKKSAKAKK